MTGLKKKCRKSGSLETKYKEKSGFTIVITQCVSQRPQRTINKNELPLSLPKKQTKKTVEGGSGDIM